MTYGNIATIDAAKPRLTLINVYEVEAGKQPDLARLLSEITDGNIRRTPASCRSAFAWRAIPASCGIRPRPVSRRKARRSAAAPAPARRPAARRR